MDSVSLQGSGTVQQQQRPYDNFTQASSTPEPSRTQNTDNHLSSIQCTSASQPSLLSSELSSMPLTDEFKNGGASTTAFNLPSAVEHASTEPRSARLGSSTHSHELAQRLSRLQLTTELSSRDAFNNTSNSAGRRSLHATGLRNGRDSDGEAAAADIDSGAKTRRSHPEPLTSPSDNDASASSIVAIANAAGSTQASTKAATGVKHTPNTLEIQTCGLSRLNVQGDAPSHRLLRPTSASTSARTQASLPTTSLLSNARMSFVDAQTLGTSDSSSDFQLHAKRTHAATSARDGSQSYSRSIAKFLTSSSSGVSSPRIYPIAYTPGDAMDDDDDDNDATGNTNRQTARSVTTTRPYSARQTARSRRSSIAAGAPLAPQTVQIVGAAMAATVVGQVAAPPGQHRAVFLRAQKTVTAMFGQPQEALHVKVLNRLMFVLIILNFSIMALETCEGQNFDGTDPAFPYLPTEATYKIVDAVLSTIFSLELLGRVALQRFAKAILLDPFTIADCLALVPWYCQLVLTSVGVNFNVDHMNGSAHAVVLFRLLRAVRLGNVLRQHEQTRILYLSIRASLRPLGITMFFLLTLVMVLATALYYAEPCYNVHTCQFTDIFNAAYFIMVTVATVGYGNQVPSLNNWASVSVTGVAMICGQMYFAMPVFIIGNNFQSTYENFQWNTKRKMRRLDETLRPFDAHTLHASTTQLTATQLHLLTAWRVVQLNIAKLIRQNKVPPTSVSANDASAAQTLRLVKIQDAMSRLLGAHTEACEQLQVFVPHKKKKTLAVGLAARSDGMLSHMYVRARRAMARKDLQAIGDEAASGAAANANARVASDSMSLRDASMMAATSTIRGRIWLAIEVPNSSPLARWINRVIVGCALLSVLVFCFESLPELSRTGIATAACRRAVHEYCTKTGFGDTNAARLDTGCFVRDANGAVDLATRVRFTCTADDLSRSCYSRGSNFGSLDAAAPRCIDVFNPRGASLICYRQQCNAVHTIVDMEPYWVYLEWLFGITFTLELALRFAASAAPTKLLRDLYIIFDILSVVPFFADVVQYAALNVEPTYAIVATSPSLFSILRVLKTTRILKLTRHFKGTKVLASTAKAVWRQLTIPIFFLFTGCIIAGAVFYEIERGTECFVGRECLWWGKNVLTPKLAADLPDGKRTLIQDKRPTIITDMLHSTWMSYTTLTAVGYGDLVPRTAVGKVFCICVVIISTIYSAMPVSLVGSKFYELYEQHMEKMVVKRGGSSAAWHATKRGNKPAGPHGGAATNPSLAACSAAAPGTSARAAIELFALSESDLDALHQFTAMKRTLTNLQRNLDNFGSVGLDIHQQQQSSIANAHASVLSGGAMASMREAQAMPQLAMRKTDTLELSIEQKSNAVMDTLLQFSRVIEKIQDAPPAYEALVDDPLQKLVGGKTFAAMRRK